MTDINFGASVQCSDCPCGKATNVVLNPVTRKASHIVVEDKKLPQNSTRLVPIGKVTDATQTQINLNYTKNDVVQMPAFMFTDYIHETAPGKGLTYYSVQVKNIPADELALSSGMEIDASDGKVGKLDEVVLNSKSGEVTHLLMQQGYLWGKKEVAVPVSTASSTAGGVIHLKLNKKAVGELPYVLIKH